MADIYFETRANAQDYLVQLNDSYDFLKWDYPSEANAAAAQATRISEALSYKENPSYEEPKRLQYVVAE